MRSIKSEEEIAELERASVIGYKMHTTAMRLARPGVTEQYIGGVLDGIASSYGAQVSFPSIVSMHGEILHGYPSPRALEAGRLLLVDAGAETNENYCSDHTRTTPISGKFTTKQKEIYDIVADCHDLALSHARPGVRWWDVHMAVCALMTDRLKELGLMKGDTEEAVRAGAHALFLPHGLGHMMGMDVHDMEGLGQVYVYPTSLTIGRRRVSTPNTSTLTRLTHTATLAAFASRTMCLSPPMVAVSLARTAFRTTRLMWSAMLRNTARRVR